ncbi:hypothetical protein F2Q69_00023504 [Brassica cretica]|uniref:Uncharacterized protein n=1 Tax=Brassica cretica TaxID=69181 RepID=A0A8S9QDY4_BRACR|nr:hypothetical protein F2Q69_00023504 [Brassica cretica]
MNAPTNKSKGTSRKSIRSKNPNSVDKRQPPIDTPVSTSIDSHSKLKISLFIKKNMSIDYGFLTPDEFGIFRDPDGHARAMDERILQVSREDIADILQLSNGHDNLFMQQRSIPDNIPAVPDEHPRADTTEIGSQQSCQPVGQKSIDKDALTSFDRAPPPSIDRRYECDRRAYDIYGARKFRWEQKDEYGVYRDECKEQHATSFTPTKLAPEIYTKNEINEMVTGIFGAQEKLEDELKTLVDDTYQPLHRGYNELFRSMAEMRTEIESMQHILEKEATTSPLIDANKATSIDANKATSIDVKPQTSQIPAEAEILAEKKDEWEIAYINTKINDVYNPLNNNVDWLSTRIDLLQQDLDTIRKKDQQPATSIDICTITSIDSKFAAMEDRLQTYEDMHDRFTSPIMRYLDTLSTQMMNVQRDIGTLNDQHDFQEECSTSIDRHNQGALGTPKFPSYDPLDLKLEKNSKSTTRLGAARRNISFSGLDVVRTRQQECESLPAHTRNNSTKRQHKKQTQKPPTNPQNLENSSPTVPNVYRTKATDMTNNGARVEEDIPHDFFNLNQQREDLRNFADSGAFRNYIERNNAELRRIHSIMDMATSSSPNIDRLIEEM